MRKLVLQMQMSVDGFVGAYEDRDWQLWGWGAGNRWDDELKRDFNSFVASVDTILLSRVMVEDGYLTHWGKAAEQYPADPFYAFAQRIVALEKVVLSDRLASSIWPRTSVRSGDLPKEVAVLKAGAGGPIVTFGGAGFASALLAAGLVDEVQLYVNPAVLGSGVALFDQTGFRKLRLLGAKAYACGMVVTRYAPAG